MPVGRQSLSAFTLYRRYCAYYCLLMVNPNARWSMCTTLGDRSQLYRRRVPAGRSVLLLKRHEEGIALLEKEQRDGPGAFLPLGFLAWAYVRGGRRADAERFLTKLRGAARYRYVPPATIAMAALAVDDAETALMAMEEVFFERDPNLSFGIRTHYFHRLRADARYHDLLERMNLRSGLKGSPNSQSVH